MTDAKKTATTPTSTTTAKAKRGRTAHVLFTRAPGDALAFANVTAFGDRNKALEAIGTTHRGCEYIALPFGADLAATLTKLEQSQ